MGRPTESPPEHGPQEPAARGETVPSDGPRGASARRRPRGLLVLVCIVAAVAGGGYWWRSKSAGLDRARQAADRGDWRQARLFLNEYLDWAPDDSAARLLMAETLIKDSAGGSEESVRQAIEHLQRIPDEAPNAAAARLQEGRLTLLILRRPGAAERLLRESLALDPDSYDANLLMWKLLDLTGRHVASHDHFWRVFELSPEQDRPARLRDWFYSEFFPETANDSFYQALGVTSIGKIPASVNLLVQFREVAPDTPCLHAALANYYLEEGQPTSSLELLQEAPDLEQAMHDSFFAAVLCEVLIELGEFDKARRFFAQFPEPHSGYLFWRAEALLRQYVDDDAAGAVSSYRQALATPAGKFDWGLMMKMAECLRKIDALEDAQKVQKRVDYLTQEVLTKDRTFWLQKHLPDLHNPEVVENIRDLYQEFGLSREAEAWETHRQSLIQLNRTFRPNERRQSSQGP